MAMKRAAIGIRVHSGWGALVALYGKPGSEEIIERCRVEIIEPGSPGAAQPYHFAEKMNLTDAEKHIARCATESRRLACERLQEITVGLRDRGFGVANSTILLAAGRALPPLPQVLTSHALIHAAEGEFFRQVFRAALEALKFPVIGIPERELQQRALAVFGRAAGQTSARIEAMGRSLGPPWTQDQKAAALAAALVLAGNERHKQRHQRAGG